jgi:hypothetical protein
MQTKGEKGKESWSFKRNSVMLLQVDGGSLLPKTCKADLALEQGHLVKGEDTEAFNSPLWSRNCTSKTVGARPNLRPHLK